MIEANLFRSSTSLGQKMSISAQARMSSKVAAAEGGYGGPITGFVARPTVSCRLPMPQWLCSPAQSMARPTSMTTQCETSTEIFWATAVKLHTIGLHWPRAHGLGGLFVPEGWSDHMQGLEGQPRGHARFFIRSVGTFSSTASDVETKFQILKLKASPRA